MNEDLEGMSAEALRAEVARLRSGIRAHRDSSGHELCWHHPALWGLLPEPVPRGLAVPDWPQFLRGCIRYRQSLDEQLPSAPRVTDELSPAAPPQQPALARTWASTLGGRAGLETLHWGSGWGAGLAQAFTPEDGGFALRYQYRWDASFQLSSAALVSWHRGVPRSSGLARTADGRWVVDGVELESLKGCTDFDLWPSPSTNTLAIERLRLTLGERREIEVAYCEAPTLALRRERQVYQRLSERTYRFESPSAQFVAELELDGEKLVRSYPGLFTQT